MARMSEVQRITKICFDGHLGRKGGSDVHAILWRARVQQPSDRVCGGRRGARRGGRFTCAAQVLYGSIVGNVTDASGAAVPGATVTITDQQRSLTRNEVTDDTGRCTFSTVPTEYYRVRVALTGFQPFERDNVRVTLNSVVRVNATLGVGEVTETVMVVADTPILQTDRAEVRSEISTTGFAEPAGPARPELPELFKCLPRLYATR